MKSLFKLGLRSKVALTLSGLLVFMLVANSYASYWHAQKIAMKLEQSKFAILNAQLESELKNQRELLLLLRDAPPIKAIIRAQQHSGIDPQSGHSTEEWEHQLEAIFEAFMANHTLYFQVRYIDQSGRELVRVERSQDGIASITPTNKLQDKSNRDYVQKTLKLKLGEIYFSDITLNREHGVIEKPHVPVLRMATPIYADGENRPASLIVFNLFAEPLFKDIHSESNGTKRYVINDKGYFIIHPDPSKVFGFDLGIDFTLQQFEKELASLSKLHESFVRYDDNHHEVDGFQKVHFSPLEPERYWLLMLQVPEKLLFSEVEETLDRMLLSSFVLGVIFILIIGWLINKKIINPVVDLESATLQLQAGDLSVRIDSLSVDDEFRTLYNALNAFAENQQRETKRLKSEVEIQAKRLAAVMDNVVDGIITITEHGEITSFNHAAEKIFGYQQAEVMGQNVQILMPEPYHSAHDGYLKHHRETGEKKIIGIGREVKGKRKDGSVFPMDLGVSELLIDQHRNFVGIIRDISERKQAEDKIKQMAHYDHLTHLPNRALLSDRLQQALRSAKRNQKRLALMFLDLDGFKAINDSMGHDTGDLVLQAVAKRLQANVREADTTSRIGGDEFCILLEDLHDNDNAAQKATEIIADISAPYPDIGKACILGCSIGISLFPQDASNQEDLIKFADDAMYHVKRAGKNNYSFYKPEMSNHA